MLAAIMEDLVKAFNCEGWREDLVVIGLKILASHGKHETRGYLLSPRNQHLVGLRRFLQQDEKSFF
jgi:hypothetical protein